MASQFNGSTGIPEREQLFTVEGDDGGLKSFLTIKPPEDSAKTPPVLSFKRKREVEIPWGNIFKGIADKNPVSVQPLRTYFEASWGYDELKRAIKNDKDLLLKNKNVQQIDSTDDPLAVYLPNFDESLDENGNPTTCRTLDKGFVLRHGATGRLYRIVESGAALTADHFTSWEMYDKAWNEYIAGAELVFEKDEEARKYYTDFEEIDLRPVVIERKFGELALAKAFATEVKDRVAGVTTALIDQIVKSTLNADEIEDLQRRVLRLQIGEQDARRRIERLVSQAASLGFTLLPEGGDVPDPPNGKDVTKKVEPGLYTQYTRTARWTTSHKRTETYKSGWWIFGKTKSREVTDKRQHEQQVLDYRLVDTSKDLLSEKRRQLAVDGMEVFVFDRSPDGFVTLDGTPLRRVMERCDFDEDFRQACAVILPVYEESLMGERIVAKYSIFKRPLPGILPTMLPRLALEESLSYRIAWREMQLGELVSSINLAPGEERRVTMTKTFKQETTVSRSATSVFDISQSDSTDLATEMENQTRQESQDSSNLSFSAKASGSYGFVSAEATASGGTSHSLNQVSQAIGKVARKAARSVSQQNREEVSTTSTAQTEITNTDESEAKLTNINQGRSLNLMFYRLYNKFTGGLYLDGLGFSVIPGVELIAGSGVHDSHSFSLDDFHRLMHELDDERLPFDLRQEQRAEYRARVLDSVKELLNREYRPESEAENSGPVFATVVAPGADDADSAEPTSAPATISVGLLSLPSIGAGLFGAAADAEGEDPGFEDLGEFAEALRRNTIKSDVPMVPQDLLVATPGLYLDAVVGTRAGTEPYSEEMRAQEVRMRAADVFARESEALYQRAQAMRLAHMSGTDSGCWITGIMPQQQNKSLRLALSEPLPEGNWHLRYDGKSVATLDRSKSIGKNPIVKVWPQEQAWLRAPDLVSRIDLFDEDTGARIEYPLYGLAAREFA